MDAGSKPAATPGTEHPLLVAAIVHRVLAGIDRTEGESEEGWWETSTGAEFGAKKRDELVAALGPSTPAARWRQEGEADPHAGHYDGERARLILGKLTDDELANGAFLEYDRRLDITRALAKDPDYHPPIVWMQAVKDRIRWLSRSLVAACGREQSLKDAQRLAAKKLRAALVADPAAVQTLVAEALEALR